MSFDRRIPEQMARAGKWLDRLPVRDLESLEVLHYYDCGDHVTCLDLNLVAASPEELDRLVLARLQNDTGGVFQAAPPEQWLDFLEHSKWVTNRGLHPPRLGVIVVSLHAQVSNADTCPG